MKIDPRITLALIFALFLETAGGLIWAGRAAARLDEVERAVATQPEVAERLARLARAAVTEDEAIAAVREALEALLK